jgi:hypothetical protein
MIEVQNTTHLEIHQAEPVMVYDLAVIINTIYQQNVEPTQAGRIPKRVVNKLRPQLKGLPRYNYDGDDDYVNTLFSLLVQMRILQISTPPFSDMKARLEPGPVMSTWASLDLPRQMANVLKGWLEVPTLFDVIGTDYDSWDDHWSSYAYYYTRAILQGRRVLLEQLLNCTPGKWYTVESLLEHLWQEQPLALYQLPKSAQKTELRKARESHDLWMKSDGQVYIGMLMSSLAEVGMLSLGYQPQDDTAHPALQALFESSASNGGKPVIQDKDESEEYVNPDMFQLTPEGARLLAAVLNPQRPPARVTKEPERSLIVQPNFEVFLLQPDLPALYAILPFVQVNQISAASRLTLTKASLLRGIASGHKIEQILQVFSEHSQKELPQNVVYTLQDWAKQYKEVRLSRTLLIEAPSEATATQLYTSTKMQAFGVRQLTPTILVVEGNTNLQELRTILGKEGVTLHVSGDFSASR